MFTLYIEYEAWHKMSALARLCKHEVSGLMEVEVDDDGDVRITDAFMLEQNGSAASTHLDMDAVIAFYVKDTEERVKKLKKGEGVTQTNKLGWFHSHPGSGSAPSYSSTDHTTLKDLADGTKGADRPFFVGLVLDSSGEHATAYLQMAAPISLKLQGPVKVLSHNQAAITTWAEKELKDKITTKVGSAQSKPTNNVRQSNHQSLGTRGYDTDFTTYALGKISKGEDFYNGIERCYYEYLKDVDLFIPTPTQSRSWVGGAFIETNDRTTMAPMPVLRWYKNKAWAVMIRPLKHDRKKVTKAETKERRKLDEVSALGNLYLAPYPGRVSACITCSVPSFQVSSEHTMCMTCERFDMNCRCPDMTLALFNEAMANFCTPDGAEVEVSTPTQQELIELEKLGEEELEHLQRMYGV